MAEAFKQIVIGHAERARIQASPDRFIEFLATQFSKHRWVFRCNSLNPTLVGMLKFTRIIA